jgi:hypothetical protein
MYVSDADEKQRYAKDPDGHEVEGERHRIALMYRPMKDIDAVRQWKRIRYGARERGERIDRKEEAAKKEHREAGRNASRICTGFLRRGLYLLVVFDRGEVLMFEDEANCEQEG